MFNQSVDPRTFTAADVQLLDPSGKPVAVTNVQLNTNPLPVETLEAAIEKISATHLPTIVKSWLSPPRVTTPPPGGHMPGSPPSS